MFKDQMMGWSWGWKLNVTLIIPKAPAPRLHSAKSLSWFSTRVKAGGSASWAAAHGQHYLT